MNVSEPLSGNNSLAGMAALMRRLMSGWVYRFAVVVGVECLSCLETVMRSLRLMLYEAKVSLESCRLMFGTPASLIKLL